MHDYIDRRSFIKKGVIASTGILGGAVSFGESSAQVRFHRSGANSPDLVRVGMLCCGPDSHTNSLWGSLINPTPGKIRQTGMLMTYCWDIDHVASETFGKKYGCTPVKNYYDMVGKVDGIIHGGYASNPVNHKLAAPYLEARIPIHINRPFSNSYNKAKIIIEKAKSYGTPLMCGSSFEYTREVEIMRKKVKSLGNITGYSASNSMSDYSTHGIHGVYACYRCIGGPVTSVSYQTEDWHRPNGLMVFEHPGRQGGKSFYGTLQHIPGGLTNCSLKVWSGNGEYFEQWWFWEQGPYDRDTFMWIPTLIAIQRMFETGEMPEPYENILEKTALFLTGFKSHLEHGGAPVKVNSLPPDWEAPLITEGSWGPAKYEESMFD